MITYVDANVFICLIFDEFGRKLEYMSYRTKDFFERVLECNHDIIISKAVIKEILTITKLKEEEILNLFNGLENKIRLVNFTRDDLIKAIKLNQKKHVGKIDCLHLIIALKEKCDCIVTWNKKDFNFQKQIKILDPSQL